MGEGGVLSICFSEFAIRAIDQPFIELNMAGRFKIYQLNSN